MTEPPAKPASIIAFRWPWRRALDVGLLLAIVTLLADQVSKVAVEVAMNPPRTVPLTPFFNLVLHYNWGISLEFLSTGRVADAGPWVLIPLSSAIVAALFVWLLRTTDPWKAGALGAIMGGVIGNILDRLSLDHVTEFLDFYVGAWHWPAFNLADTFIGCGIIVLLFRSFLSPRKQGPTCRR